MVVMAANGNGAEQAYAPVLTAMSTMRDGVREQKEAAHVYLESFQKSVCCFHTALRLIP
jgi:transportin-3